MASVVFCFIGISEIVEDKTVLGVILDVEHSIRIVVFGIEGGKEPVKIFIIDRIHWHIENSS